MERLYSQNDSTRKDIFSDPSHRMSQRPFTVKSGEGLGYQDIGSSLVPLKPAAVYGKSSKSKSKPATALPARPQPTPPRISEDESDDELLLSSQNSMGGDATSSAKRVVKGKKPDTSLDEVETLCVNGRVLTAHPDYKPSSSKALKGLRFKKNKKSIPDDDTVAEVPPPSSSLTDSQDLFKPISDEIEILDGPPPKSPSSSRQMLGASSTRPRSPSVTRTAARQTLAGDSTAEDSPRPRVIVKSTLRKRDSSPGSTPCPAAPKDNSPLRNKTTEQPANPSSKRTTKKPTFPSPSRREPQGFPMSLQAKENVTDGAQSGDASTTTKISRAVTFAHTSKPISLPSPLKTKPISRGTTFPTLSPLSSLKDKGKARAKSPAEDKIDLTDGPGKRGGPKPFPMSSQMLADVDRRQNSPTHSLASTKRTSSDDSDAERGRIAKKRKDSRSRVLDTLDYLHEPMEDDSLEMGYARDPSKMCPYCDEELPSHPTPFLRHLLATARKKSTSDPRPRNRGGLKAPLTIYISVCQRHRFESHQLPIATEKGWPKTIDFTKVPFRVRKMKKALQAIILDKDDISDTEDLDINDGGPRRKSVFWREIKKDVKKQGSRTVIGVKGQFASFEKTQPGYYGEQGSVIIHQTLFDLFPPSNFDASFIAPLAPAEFIQRVLVPEVAVRLIAQDLNVDTEDAIVTLRESAQYGVAMFPDTGESKRKGADADDEMGVADHIVMERARARRKELAEEEKVEKEMLEEERAAQRAKARENRRQKALERAQQVRQTKERAETQMEDASEASEASVIRRTQRRTRQRAATGHSESDAMSVDSLTSGRSVRIAKKGRGGGIKTIGTTLQSNGSDSDSVEHVDDSKRKISIGGFASLHSDAENASTPRPAGGRTETATIESAVGGSDARILPLQIARSKAGTSALNTHDGWSRSLRTAVPNDSDSEMSNVSRRSQKLVRDPIRKGGTFPWLFTPESSSSDSS